MTQSRTQGVDAQAWTPFDADARPAADEGQSVIHSPRTVEGTGWRIIEGGPAVDAPKDEFDAAADEALAAIAEPVDEAPGVDPAAAPPIPVEEPSPAPVAETAPTTVETPVETPVEMPVETVPGFDSTPHTPHSAPTTPESETPARTGTQAGETPHSTPWWRTAATTLNPGGVLFKQQASLAEIVTYANDAPYSANPAVRALEIGWNRAVAVPVSLALYAAAAAYKRLWRGLGTSTIGVLWVVTVHTSPLDASTVWTWTVLGYWALSAFLVPAIVTTKK